MNNPRPVPKEDEFFKYNENQYKNKFQPNDYQNYFDNTQPTQSFRMPSYNNPMMNVPIMSYDNNQIYNDYTRYDNKQYETPTTIKVREDVDSKLLNKLFQDPADMLFDRNNSQRQWYSAPSGSVPSDQTKFAESLYGRENVCKEGSIWMRYGLEYTDNSLSCTGYEGDGKLTNFGSIN